jgi:hypothetical protein
MSKNSRKQTHEAFQEWYNANYNRFIKKHVEKKRKVEDVEK